MSNLGDQVQAALGDAFRVQAELPAGGMSRVFLAVESSLNRRVVVKVLPPELTSDVSAARFRREAELLAQLQHPHILPIISSGSRGGLLYYIMPYVQGESVRHRLEREGMFPVEDAIRVVTEVVDALSYAHAAGVLHRDIKPENILLEGRHAVLADFGVARALQQSQTGGRLTATGMSVGTPGYMSPEQVSGDSVDARADLYALAVVGYEMLTGKPPFSGPTAQAVLAAHLTTPPLPVEELRPEVPLHVSRAIARALSKRPEDRFESAGTFRDALEGREIAPATAPALPLPGRWLRRRTLGILLAVSVALAVVAVLWRRGTGIDPGLLGIIRATADSGWVDEIARLLDSGGVAPDHPVLRETLARFTGRLAVEVEPRSALVEIVRVEPIQSFSGRGFRPVGATQRVAVLAGEYLLRGSAPGFQERMTLVQVAADSSAEVALRLLPSDSALGPRVQVPAGSSPVGGEVGPLLISRFEVTNEEYLGFVSAGGYRDRSLWPDRMWFGDQGQPWDQAVTRFVDRTGLPGPRTWESGRYPVAKATHPVAGITWYEAAAYAKWVGGQLPTAAAWWRASLGAVVRPYPWGTSGTAVHLRANLEGVETATVGSYPLSVSPFGAMDMAGNVREWLADSAGATHRFTAGGSWQEPVYTAGLEWVERFPPGYTSTALGFRVMWREAEP
ncbi:MAG TPA: bifunctional serine/threonine-protein kinase/formylglycine-generating enzyme family protein [Gemmatimonadales bacterium]